MWCHIHGSSLGHHDVRRSIWVTLNFPTPCCLPCRTEAACCTISPPVHSVTQEPTDAWSPRRVCGGAWALACGPEAGRGPCHRARPASWPAAWNSCWRGTWNYTSSFNKSWVHVIPGKCGHKFWCEIFKTHFMNWHLNSLWPGEIIYGVRSLSEWSALVKVVACHLIGDKPLPEKMLTFPMLTFSIRPSVTNFSEIWIKIPIHENAFENVVCKIAVNFVQALMH